jgi:nucleoside-diphosphate-sugar epimerase
MIPDDQDHCLASPMLQALCRKLSGRILVTGATGLVGGRLTEILRVHGVAVTALVRPGRQTDRLQSLDVLVRRGDVTDVSAVRTAAEGCTAVVHCAASTRRSRYAAKRAWAINAQGPATVWRAAREAGLQRMVHCSTAGVHGPLAVWPADESAPLRPNTPYRRSKLEGELQLAAVAAGGPVEWVVARLASVCGPGAYGSWRSLHNSVISGRTVLIGGARQPIHVVDIDDVCQGLLRCLTQPGRSGNAYLIAGPEPIALRDLLEQFAAIEGRELRVRQFPARPLAAFLRSAIAVADHCHWMPAVLHSADFLLNARAYDIWRARRDLGYTPVYNTAATVARTVQDQYGESKDSAADIMVRS